MDNEIKCGDEVEIIEIHPDDAYYHTGDLIGKRMKVKFVIEKKTGNLYACRLEKIGETRYTFYKVYLKKIISSDDFLIPM